MRWLVSMVLLGVAANTAFAHTIDGSVAAMLGHQVFGMHHFLFTALIVAVIFYLGRNWYRGKRVQ